MADNEEWRNAPGATEKDISTLTAIAPFTLPESYLSFLRYSNGGEGPAPGFLPWVIFNPALVVVGTCRDRTFEYISSDLFVIGSNGAGEAIAFDLRTGPPYAVVAFDMIAGLTSIVIMAESFDDLIVLIDEFDRIYP